MYQGLDKTTGKINYIRGHSFVALVLPQKQLQIPHLGSKLINSKTFKDYINIHKISKLSVKISGIQVDSTKCSDSAEMT